MRIFKDTSHYLFFIMHVHCKGVLKRNYVSSPEFSLYSNLNEENRAAPLQEKQIYSTSNILKAEDKAKIFLLKAKFDGTIQLNTEINELNLYIYLNRKSSKSQKRSCHIYIFRLLIRSLLLVKVTNFKDIFISKKFGY